MFHDEPVFESALSLHLTPRFLVTVYELQSADLETRIVERNIDYSCQFIFHELWWYEHARDKETSDSQRIKVTLLALFYA